MKLPVALVLAAVLLAGCSGADFDTPTEPVSSAPGSHPPKPSPAAAYVRKPIRSVTPGVVLTRSAAQICTPGWATAHRRSLTTAQKQYMLTLYGLEADTKVSEWDHLLALEVGGGNGPENVWPMTDHAQDERKDDLEDSLHRQICDGTITPAQAQRQLRSFWRHW